MAEYELTPIVFDEDYETIYGVALSYFAREETPFNMSSKYLDKNNQGFTIDASRRSSFIATERKASLHIIGTGLENEGTEMLIIATSADTKDELEASARDRIEIGMQRILAHREALPTTAAMEHQKQNWLDRLNERTNGKANIIVLAIAVVIIAACFPTSCNRGWFFS